MKRVKAPEVAAQLLELGRRLELKGGNPYRARAYKRAAEALSTQFDDLDEIIQKGALEDIPGIGAALGQVITTIHETGSHPMLEALRREFPATALEMLGLPGLRPENVAKLHEKLGITSVAELEAAARSGEIGKTKGLGPALQRKALSGIEMARSGKSMRHLHRAEMLLENAVGQLQSSGLKLKRVTPAGDFRRGLELVSQLAVVAETAKAAEPQREEKRGELTVFITGAAHYGAALLFATGSEEHLTALQARARKKGSILERDGLYQRGKLIAAASEEEIYAALVLPFIPPELRESGDEVAMAAKGALPDIVTDDDIRGVVHAHTDQSDGSNTLKQMAEGARKRGYDYLGLTDHSRAAHYAGGLSIEEVAAQQRDVDRLNTSYGGGFRVWKGIESDILGDGSLDYPDEVLDTFELVVASVHSRFRMDPKEQTARIVRAVQNRYTHIVGHVTGRQLLRRPGYEVDLERVLSACAKSGVAVEINAHPWRLDLDWRWCKRAVELGCLFSIDADAHSISEIDNTRWGVLMARKAGVPKDRIVNCFPREKFGEFLRAKRGKATTRKSSGNARRRK